MIREDLDDREAPEEIRQFVRDHQHIKFTNLIDRGFNGIVYFGTRIKMKEDVVVKFYLAREEFDASEEALILRRIEHPNILRVDDIRFLPPFNTYFLSPLISGGDLQNLIETEHIPTERALSLTRGLLLGLNVLHSQYYLVHRDLKPANLLFCSESDNPIIADLGSVKRLDELSGYTSASRCTTLYLPPESIKKQLYSIKSDIYQIGITIYQLLGGCFPLETPVQFLTDREQKQLNKVDRGLFWNQKLDQLINNKILKGKLLDLNSLPAYLPAKFKAVIRKACHPDDNKRYNTVSELLTDTNKLIRDFPSYSKENDSILVTHKNLNIYKITSDDNVLFKVSKQINGRDWRRVKKMDGSLDETIKLTLRA
tara:strand:+ start:5500 stop:6606 length:1107 start_codon:yes stop_codon:yes gene_type:complete